MAYRCPVCGGADTCPEGLYVEVRSARDDEILDLRPGESPGPGWTKTHITSRYHRWVRERGKDGFELERVGSKQRWRVQDHWPDAEPTWVGMCDYAIYVKRR